MAHPPLTPVGSALAGALGAVFSNAVVYPLDTVKTRLQALPAESTLPTTTTHDPAQIEQQRPRDVQRIPGYLLTRLKRWKMLEMLVRIIKTEGLSGAFKGFTANMINTFSMQFAYFFFHTLLRNNLLRYLQKRQGRSSPLSTPSELLVGALAGGLAQIFTIPVSVIATRQQLWLPPATSTTSASTSYSQAQCPSLFETGKEIIAESGLSGLWTGLKPGLVLTVNPAITYGSFERMKSAVLSRSGRDINGRLTVGESFWLGVGSKAIATIVTYPYIFAKVRLQAKRDYRTSTISTTGNIPSYADIASQPPSDDSAIITNEKSVDPPVQPVPVPARNQQVEERGAIPLLRAVYKEKGFKGWYRGLTAQLIKAVLCQGILFVSKDQFEKWAWMIIVLLTSLRRRIALT